MRKRTLKVVSLVEFLSTAAIGGVSFANALLYSIKYDFVIAIPFLLIGLGIGYAHFKFRDRIESIYSKLEE